MNPLVVSVIILWVLQIASIIVLVGVVQQVGLLHLRLPARGAGPVENTPAPGTTIELPPVASIESREVNVLVPGRLALVMFASPSCSLCAPVLEGARRLTRSDPEVHATIAIDGDTETGLTYLRRHGFSDGVPAQALEQLDPGDRPFTIILSSTGTVLASGVPNDLEQLEVLVSEARRTEKAPQTTVSEVEILPFQDNVESEEARA